MEYIDIEKQLIPYEFEISLEDELFKLEINYNAEFDLFTVDLYKGDTVIVLGEKLVYGKPLFLSCMHKEIPGKYIIPLDPSENTDKITFENLNEQVFLYVIEDDEDGTV